MYRIRVHFCLYDTFLPVTCRFHPFWMTLDIWNDLWIDQTLCISEIQNHPTGLLIDVLFLLQYKLLDSCVPLSCLPWRNTCFQNNMCAETTLWEFASSLFLRLVISCEPVSVKTESRNFSVLDAQRVYRWQWNNHPCSNILAYLHRDIVFLIDGWSNCTWRQQQRDLF